MVSSSIHCSYYSDVISLIHNEYGMSFKKNTRSNCSTIPAVSNPFRVITLLGYALEISNTSSRAVPTGISVLHDIYS